MSGPGMHEVGVSADVAAPATALYDRAVQGGSPLHGPGVEVRESVIGERIVWGPAGGDPGPAVAVTFQPTSEGHCRVTLRASTVPDGEVAATRVAAEQWLGRLAAPAAPDTAP